MEPISKQPSIAAKQSMSPTEVEDTWNNSQEILLASIGDRANCYRWMHTKCQTHYEWLNFYLTIPSIVVSAAVGSTTIGLPGLISDMESQKVLSIVLGSLGLGVGVMTSLNQYLKCAQLSESHRNAGIAYAKLHRRVSSELAMRRDQRESALSFLKSIRIEQDRLNENCPMILDFVIDKFNKEFKDNAHLEKPEIAGDLDHIAINTSSRQVEHEPLLNQEIYSNDELDK